MPSLSLLLLLPLLPLLPLLLLLMIMPPSLLPLLFSSQLSLLYELT